jgi:cytochrome c-type biogenesis protein
VFLGNISIGLAVLAGMASFLSPCVLSLVPAYVGYLGGISTGSEVTANRRVLTVAHGLAFVLGFSTVFILLAWALGTRSVLLIAWLADQDRRRSRHLGCTVGVFRLRCLITTSGCRTCRTGLGFLSSALMGVFFPQAGAVCGARAGAILTLALNGARLARARSCSRPIPGAGHPLLLAAMGIGWVSTILSQYGKVMHYVEVSMGVVMVGVGLMLFSGVYEIIAQRFQFFWIDFGI